MCYDPADIRLTCTVGPPQHRMIVCYDRYDDTIWELGPCGYVGYLWISMDIYGYPWIYTGLQWNISDLLYWIRYPSWISIHIHRYPTNPSKISNISTFYIQKRYLCIIHAVIHQGVHSYLFYTLHIHVYWNEISILDIHSYPYSISMY